MKIKATLLIVALLAFVFPITAHADGIIVPEPPICDPCPPPPCPGPLPCPPPMPVNQLVVRYHHVTVTIEDQIAITHVDQVFYNPNEWTVEGTYMFPLPADAAVSGFTLWVDGKPVEGEVLDAEQARRTYQEIVSSLRDPALLEYADRGAVRARIFPIPARGERRIELEYTQALTAEGGLVRYIYPLSTEKFSAWPLEDVSISVDLHSSLPVRAVYSPSHPVDINRESDNHVVAGYEDQDVLPDNDFALYYSIGESQAFHLFTYRDPQDPANPDGFFLLLLAPRPDAQQQTLPKDVLLVLDRSGSMEGEKFTQAQEALRFILRRLNPEDRFNIVSFSTGLDTYGRSLRPADEANEALSWVDRLSAQGSTDINRALLEAASMIEPGRPTYLIFLTDGLPTEGVVQSQQILDNLEASAPESLRLFSFGVGYDVDTFLLNSLARDHHGTSAYVLPGEHLDELLSAFYTKISTPVLTDLQLDFGELPVYDLYPSPLPDLFSGSQIVVVGRYRRNGQVDVTLEGTINGQTQSFHYPDQAFVETSDEETGALAALPRLWATRKIGYLLNEIRLQGANQELIDQIVRLSIRYGIVTPYTSYLVTEPMPLGEAGQNRIAEQAYEEIQSAPTAPSSGQAAVEKAADQGLMAGAQAPNTPDEQAAGRVKIVGARTFVLSDQTWIDTAFDPDRMKTTKVAFLSEDYFALAQASPELAHAFALGQSVIALSGGIAYEVVPQDQAVGPVKLPPENGSASQTPDPEAVTPQPTQTPGAQVGPTSAVQPDSDQEESTSSGLCPSALIPLGMLAVWALSKQWGRYWAV